MNLSRLCPRLLAVIAVPLLAAMSAAIADEAAARRLLEEASPAKR